MCTLIKKIYKVLFFVSIFLNTFVFLANSGIGVLVICYNRPDYFKSCIQSIMRNKKTKDLTFIFALDGGKNSKQAEYLDLIKKANLPNQHILLRDRNYGAPKNKIDGHRFAFEQCNFEKVIFMEDDLIISDYYFDFILNFHRWATTKYSNIGVVQGWNSNGVPTELLLSNALHIKEGYESWWSFVSYCMSKEVWNKINSFLYKYEALIDLIPLDSEYDFIRSKPNGLGSKIVLQWDKHYLIEDLIMDSLMETKPLSNNKNFTSKLTISKIKNIKTQSTSDCIFGISLLINSLVKLTPYASRIKHIGENGITMTSNKINFTRVGFFNNPQDGDNSKEFKVYH
jgi:hypothetical protein